VYFVNHTKGGLVLQSVCLPEKKKLLCYFSSTKFDFQGEVITAMAFAERDWRMFWSDIGLINGGLYSAKYNDMELQDVLELPLQSEFPWTMVSLSHGWQGEP
jgi:hypothetical protein